MTFWQVSLKGHEPSGALFETRKEAEREVMLLKREDQQHADRAMAEAGVVVPPTEYEIHEVQR